MVSSCRCLQGGFTGQSKFAFIPLEGEPSVAVKKSASNDDLLALAEVRPRNCSMYHDILCDVLITLTAARQRFCRTLGITDQNQLHTYRPCVLVSQAAAHAQYYTYDDYYPDDDSVAAPSVKSLPVASSAAGIRLADPLSTIHLRIYPCDTTCPRARGCLCFTSHALTCPFAFVQDALACRPYAREYAHVRSRRPHPHLCARTPYTSTPMRTHTLC